MCPPRVGGTTVLANQRLASQNVRSNSKLYSPDWLLNAPHSLVIHSQRQAQQIAYLQCSLSGSGLLHQLSTTVCDALMLPAK